MTRMNNKELLDHFARGGDNGTANRMAISEFEGWTLLWGYGYALYAARRQDDGLMFVYEGWHGYSQTTSTHINALTGKARDRYGKVLADGHKVRAVVDGEGGSEIVQAPPSGHNLILVDEAPGCDYGTLDAEDRPELSEFDGRHVPSPNGSSSR